MKKTLTTILMIATLGAYAQVEGTWAMSKGVGALGVGPSKGDVSWWSSDATTVTDRACYFDDEYLFMADGRFYNLQGGDTWLEGFQGASPNDTCGTPVAPHDGACQGSWSYDGTAGTLTLTGKGAYLGLAKVYNLGELSDPADAKSSITYEVTLNSANDTMTVEIEIAGGGYWTYIMAKSDSTMNDTTNLPTAICDTTMDSTTTNIAALELDDLVIYPNPAADHIQISTSVVMDEVAIYNAAGKEMLVRKNPLLTESINVADFPKGMYIVRYRSGDINGAEKLILK